MPFTIVLIKTANGLDLVICGWCWISSDNKINAQFCHQNRHNPDSTALNQIFESTRSHYLPAYLYYVGLSEWISRATPLTAGRNSLEWRSQASITSVSKNFPWILSGSLHYRSFIWSHLVDPGDSWGAHYHHLTIKWDS